MISRLINYLGLTEAELLDYFKKADIQLQEEFAPLLRAAVINFMRNDKNSEYMQFRRDQYKNIRDDTTVKRDSNFIASKFDLEWGEWLDHQSKKREGELHPYAYATAYEVGSLAEMLGITFYVTELRSSEKLDKEAKEKIRKIEMVGTWCAWETPGQAPFFHLYCTNNGHFHVGEDPRSTIGDGNCFYNGMTQLLRHYILTEAKAQAEVEAKSDNKTLKLNLYSELTDAQKEAYAYQQALLESFKKEPIKPLDLKEMLVQLKNMDKPIQADHQYSLDIAEKELKKNSTPGDAQASPKKNEPSSQEAIIPSSSPVAPPKDDLDNFKSHYKSSFRKGLAGFFSFLVKLWSKVVSKIARCIDSPQLDEKTIRDHANENKTGRTANSLAIVEGLKIKAINKGVDSLNTNEETQCLIAFLTKDLDIEKFKKAYLEKYKGAFFKNPWSKMYNRINDVSKSELTVKEIRDHLSEDASSRSMTVLKMMKTY